jgi:hypothetical protein
MTDRWERYAALSGVIAVVLWVVGLLVGGDVTNKDEAARILAAVKDHDARILVGGLIWTVGTAFFIWFLGVLRSRMYVAEGGTARLTATGFAGGVATAICIALAPGGDMAAALNKNDIDASAASALHNMGDAFFIGAEYLLPVLLVAAGLLALRTGLLPKWLAWVSFLIALVLLIGPIGWAALIFAFPLWVLVVSVLLWRSAERPAATPVATGT